MKKTILLLSAMVAGGITTMAQCTALSGTLSANETLYAETCYHLEGCFVVPDGKTLTIPAGTHITCASGSNLVVARGGKILATGTASNPIVFTSDQPAGSRAPGDWGGIVLLGKAPNNISGNATVEICTDRDFGGTDAADNSGMLEYIRIEYAGSVAGREEPAALLLASVGSGTVIDHIQASESARDGFRSLGGTYNAQYLLCYNAYQNDFSFAYGNISKLQFLLGMRQDINAHTGTFPFSNGVFIENDPAGSANTPLTQPLISNLTTLGPDYCSTGSSTDFRNGVFFDNNGAGSVRNSTIGKWRNNGLRIEDDLSEANTATNLLGFSYNAIIPATGGNDFSNGSTWMGCGSNMTAWITGSMPTSCSEQGNDFSLGSFGYNTNLCGNYCTARPTFTYAGTDLEDVDFSAPFNTFFDNSVIYKGAIGSSDWTASWAQLCPQEASYCVCAQPLPKAAPGLLLIPNPAGAFTTLQFTAVHTGKAVIRLRHPVTGAILRTLQYEISTPGRQKATLNVQGLPEGIYTVVVYLREATLSGILSVRP